MNRIDNIFRYLVILVVIIMLGLSVLCIYQYGGLKQYVKAGKYINEIPLVEQRTKAWDSFIGKGDGVYTGIYAGKFLGMVWVWGNMGLRPFITDKYSVYTNLDGCGKKDKSGAVFLDKKVSFNIDEWNKNARTGDFAAIVIAKMNPPIKIKEIYTYNFWPFIQKDQKTACAK